jgi:RNA polymerase primary sigma factor
MVQQTNEVTGLKGLAETQGDDSTVLKLRSAPAAVEMHELPEQFSIDTSNDSVEVFEISYSDQEDGVLKTYLHQIGKIPRLTQEEEIDLFIQIGKCRVRIDELYQELVTYLPDVDPENPPSTAILNQRITAESFPRSTERYLSELVRRIKFMNAEIHVAKNRVVEANLRLAVCIAKKYRERGLDLLDLIQEANIGLLRAVDHFDWQRGVKFGAYASWWMQQAIGGGIANHGRTIRLPAYLLSEIRKMNRAEERLHQGENHEPSREEIAEASGLTVDRLRLLDQLTAGATSLEAYVSQEGEVGDFVACEQAPDPLTEITRQNLVDEVKAALTTLPPREQRIVCLRYGLEDGEERSLRKIGTMLHLSRERVRQLEARALDRLRHPSRCERFRDFLVA